MKLKRIVFGMALVLFCVGICSGFRTKATGTTSPAEAEEAWPEAPEIPGPSAVVLEINSGTVLYEKNAHGQFYPASITKILTALLAVENSQMEEQVTFSYDAVHKTEGSGIWRDVGEVMTMEQCIYALLLNSANECAYAIAEHIGGSYENFVQMMNDRAEALGCVDTHFNNPHGLPDENHYVSSYDMALIAREAYQNEAFREIVGTRRYDIPPTNKHDEITYLRNHHKMLFQGEKYYYEYCLGGKTGYTQVAGNTLVTYAQKDGMTLVCVVLKEGTSQQYEDTRTLLDYCFDNFSSYNIAENFAKDPAGEGDFLSGGAYADIDKNAVLILPKGVAFSAAAMEVVENKGGGTVAGTLQYTYAGHLVGTADIVKTGQEGEEYPFSGGAGEEDPDSGQKKTVVFLKWQLVTAVAVAVVVLAAGAFCVYRYWDKLHWLRHNLCHARRRRRNGKRKRRKRKECGKKCGF